MASAIPGSSGKKGHCSTVTFHRRGGKAVKVIRCTGRKLRAHNRRQCRRAKGKSFRARQFVKCR
jgi:hypothetical protein